MSTRVVSITLLLLFMFSVSSASNWRHASGRVPTPCCTGISTRNITNDVIGDTYQKPSTKPPCVEAIILNTRNGKQVCVDPKSEWVQKLTAQMSKV